MLPLFLYAYEMKRLQYWQAEFQTSYTDALVRYFAMARATRDKAGLNQMLLVAIGQEAQSRRDALIESVNDDATLTADEQESIWNKLQSYQKIIFSVSELLQ